MPAGAGPQLRIDAHEFAEVLAKAKRFPGELNKELRREIRAAAKVAAKDVQTEVQKPTPQGKGRGARNVYTKKRKGVAESLSRGTRSAIAQGVGVRINSSVRNGASVRIVATPSKLSEQHKAMLKSYNKAMWRHPVFGTGTWAAQPGRPYFGKVISGHKAEFERAVLAALDKANRIMADHQ